MTQAFPPDLYIYHLLLPETWQEAARKGTYEPASLRHEGFIHFSTAENLLPSAELYFGEANSLLAIGLSADKAGEALQWESSRDGLDFPHLYRAIQTEEIEVLLWLGKNTAGRWEKIKKENLAKPRKR